MLCKNCGHELDEDLTFCEVCGANIDSETLKEIKKNKKKKLRIEESFEDEDIREDNSSEENEKKTKGKLNLTEKQNNIIEKIIFICGIVGLVGVGIFFAIVVVGLIAYGEVYLYRGYAFTRVLVTISIILMLVGFLAMLARIILGMGLKTVEFPEKILNKIIIFAVAVICLSFSIWGIADGSSSSHAGSNYLDFYSIYYECDCSYPWADVGSDYITIDTNPYDYDSDSSLSYLYLNEADNAIKRVNSSFNIPYSVYTRMVKTSALQGVQSYSNSQVTVTWTYHPDRGLEVTYDRN